MPAKGYAAGPLKQIESMERKAKKIIIFKRKRRKGYRKKQGHRQRHTVVKIDAIQS